MKLLRGVGKMDARLWRRSGALVVGLLVLVLVPTTPVSGAGMQNFDGLVDAARRGVIYGSVVRPPGLPAPGLPPPVPMGVKGAHVVATDTETQAHFEAVTNGRGSYRLTVPPGHYAVCAAGLIEYVDVGAGQRKSATFTTPRP